MKKRGMTKIVEILLILFVGFIIIYMMFSFSPQLRAAVLKHVKIFQPEVTNTTTPGFAEMKAPANSLAKAIFDARDSPTAGGCIVTPAALPADFKDNEIVLQKYSRGTDLIIRKAGFASIPISIERVYPCAVYGNDASTGEPIAKNFYDNWLDGTRCPGCKKDFNEFAEIALPKAEKIVIDGTKQDRENIFYLYKADAQHVCFFATYDGGSSCRAKQEGLDDNCANAIKASLPECAAPVTTTTTTTLRGLCDEYSQANGGGFSCQDIASCGFAKDAAGLAQCDSTPGRCVRGKCPGEIYNVCCKR